MTTKAKEKQEQEKRPPREAAALSTEEKERLLKPFERPRFPLPDLPPLARIRLFRQDPLRIRPPTPRTSGAASAIRTPSPCRARRSASRELATALPSGDEQMDGEA